MTVPIEGFTEKIQPRQVTHRSRRVWEDCDLNAESDIINQEVSLMGYSARSTAYRYTIWLHWDRVKRVPVWNRRSEIIFAEELYDHRTEELGGFTNFEHVNLVGDPQFQTTLEEQREELLEWIRVSVFKHGDEMAYKKSLDSYFEERAANITKAAQQDSVSFLRSVPSAAHQNVMLRGTSA